MGSVYEMGMTSDDLWPVRCVTRIFFLFLLKGLGVRVAYVIYRSRHLAVSLNCFLRGSNHLQADFKTNIHTVNRNRRTKA